VLTVGVILAGGVGVRMGLDVPKQFVPIAGKTSLEHSDCDLVDETSRLGIARAR
jgi:2-C-methyl-D-erythritol 4-phosphate cytidylyltransferase